MSDGHGLSWRANESIPAYVVVAVNASTTTRALRVEVADTMTSLPIGFAQDSASPDGSVEIVSSGYCRAKCANSVSAGSLLSYETATGEVVEVDRAATITVQTVGWAVHAGSSNSVILVYANINHVNNL